MRWEDSIRSTILFVWEDMLFVPSDLETASLRYARSSASEELWSEPRGKINFIQLSSPICSLTSERYRYLIYYTDFRDRWVIRFVGALVGAYDGDRVRTVWLCTRAHQPFTWKSSWTIDWLCTAAQAGNHRNPCALWQNLRDGKSCGVVHAQLHMRTTQPVILIISFSNDSR